jgi:hypothetical protein
VPAAEEAFTPELDKAIRAAVAANNGVFSTLAQTSRTELPK